MGLKVKDKGQNEREIKKKPTTLIIFFIVILIYFSKDIKGFIPNDTLLNRVFYIFYGLVIFILSAILFYGTLKKETLQKIHKTINKILKH